MYLFFLFKSIYYKKGYKVTLLIYMILFWLHKRLRVVTVVTYEVTSA